MAGPVVEDATKSGAQQAVPPPVIAHANPYSLGRALAHGDIWTKLSMVVMGLGNIVRGQIIKGAIFLVLEIGFLYLFITQGITTIAHLGVLGPVEKNTQGWVNGVYTNIEATNSIKVLLYGVGWLFIVGAFAVLWTVAVKSSFLVQSVVQKGGKPASFVQDVKDLLDGRIRVTLMSLPFVGLIVFTVLPLVTMILIAFTTFDQNHRVAFNWSGFSTFATVFSPEGSVELGVSLSLFLRVLAWTLVWAFFATFLNFFLGMFMAMIILRKGVRLKGLWRTCFSMSIAVPQFVSLLVIHQMLTQDGIVNAMFQGWGLIDTAMPFWTDTTWARVTVIIVNLWVGVPYTIMQITGILQNVPAELYEAARIDGANWGQTFIYITMPYIFFVMTPYLITTFTGNVNNFNVIFFLSNGAPTQVGESAGDTDLLITWLYRLSVDRGNYNIGAVIGILTFIVLAVVALITYRSSGSYKNEEGFR